MQVLALACTKHLFYLVTEFLLAVLVGYYTALPVCAQFCPMMTFERNDPQQG
jgi:hypothetical protein